MTVILARRRMNEEYLGAYLKEHYREIAVLATIGNPGAMTVARLYVTWAERPNLITKMMFLGVLDEFIIARNN